MKRNYVKRFMSVVLAIALVLTTIGTTGLFIAKDVTDVSAAATVVTSMDYFSANDGPTIKHSGVGTVSYGFVMPKFNGKDSSELSIADVKDDIAGLR